MIEPVEPQVWNRGERSHVLRDTDSMSQEELRLEIWRLRDELAGLAAALGSARRQLESRRESILATLELDGVRNDQHLKSERDHFRNQVAEMQNSMTWRVGRLLIRPGARLRSILRRSPDES